MTEQAKTIRGRATKTVIVFIVVGPLVGYVAMMLWDFSTNDPSSIFRNLAHQPWMLLAASMYGYLFGGLPAFLTGLAAANLLEGLRPATYVLACGLAGALTSAAVFIAAVLSAPLAMLPMLCIGGLAGIICGVLTVRLRPSDPR